MFQELSRYSFVWSRIQASWKPSRVWSANVHYLSKLSNLLGKTRSAELAFLQHFLESVKFFLWSSLGKQKKEHVSHVIPHFARAVSILASCLWTKSRSCQVLSPPLPWRWANYCLASLVLQAPGFYLPALWAVSLSLQCAAVFTLHCFFKRSSINAWSVSWRCGKPCAWQ